MRVEAGLGNGLLRRRLRCGCIGRRRSDRPRRRAQGGRGRLKAYRSGRYLKGAVAPTGGQAHCRDSGHPQKEYRATESQGPPHEASRQHSRSMAKATFCRKPVPARLRSFLQPFEPFGLRTHVPRRGAAVDRPVPHGPCSRRCPAGRGAGRSRSRSLISSITGSLSEPKRPPHILLLMMRPPPISCRPSPL